MHWLRSEKPPWAPSVESICHQRSWGWRKGQQASCVETQMVLKRPEDSDWQQRKWNRKISRNRNGYLSVLMSSVCFLVVLELAIFAFPRLCTFFFTLPIKSDRFSVRGGWTLPWSSVQGEAAIECEDQLNLLLIKLNASAKSSSHNCHCQFQKQNKTKKVPLLWNNSSKQSEWWGRRKGKAVGRI